MPLEISRRRRWTILAGGFAVLAGAGGGSYLALGSRAAATVPSTVATVGYGTVRQTVAASGTIEPAEEANLDFAVPGQVTAVEVAVGQKVAAGQVLATISTVSLQAEVDSAQATLDTDQAKLVADQSSGASAAQVASDQAAVNAAEANLSDAEKALSEAALTSSIAGTVAAVNLAVGQQAGPSGAGGSAGGGAGASGLPGSAAASSGSSASSSGAEVVVVGTGSWVVDASVDDTQIASVEDGDQATILPEGSATPVYGTVASVGLVASTNSGVSSFPVTIDVTGSPPGLYAGTSATVSILVRELQDVLVVPTRALRYTGGQTELEVEEGGRARLVPVTVGISSGPETQVLSGVSAGTRVVEPSLPGAPGAPSTRRGGFGGGFGGGGFGRPGG